MWEPLRVKVLVRLWYGPATVGQLSREFRVKRRDMRSLLEYLRREKLVSSW